uniref:Serine/threonine-protein kinase TOR n=1 Tax=Oryza barthii TaxID=65489 RepID=A0A0D3G4U2_9ORYZ
MKPSPHFPEIGKKPKDLIAKEHGFNIAAYISSGADVIAAALRKHVEEEARDLSGEAFLRFMEQLYEQICSLLQSNDVAENLLALRAIDALIDMPFGEGASKVSKFANFLRTVFEVKRDPEVLVPASAVLGHLAKAGGAMTADEVERQIKTALGWLGGDRVEYRRFAAVLILKEMAENASTVFNVHVPEFVDAIWVALRDPKQAVRERAVEALRACLHVIEKRETRWRVQWYYRMCEAAQVGLGKNASVHSIHGSLLAVGELLRNTGEFMMSRYREVADIVLNYLRHRDQLVRRSITSLLPRIAHFLRDRFVTNYLKICMDHILFVLRTPDERASGFVALGEMAGALGAELVPYLPLITSHLHDAIAPRRGRPSLEAISCVGSFAKAMGPAMEPHIRGGLLDAMFSAGLSDKLVEALESISTSIPSLLPTIQERLLDCISQALPKSSVRPGAAVGRGSRSSSLQQFVDSGGPVLVQLALGTLANFNFKGHELLEFARESVILYLEDEDCSTRKAAATCCCKLVAHSLSASSSSQFSSNRPNRMGGAKRRRLVEEIVEKLLMAAVADADVGVRSSEYHVRELAISVAGRLSEKNPAYVLPALRRYLIQLLTYLDQSMDSKCREESARLLGCLIRSCARLILPYIAPIHKALVARLREGTGPNANNALAAGVLATVGELAKVGGFAMRQYLPELMPLVVDALLDGGAVSKREVAVATLGQVIQSTGYVISPYNEYPPLLGLLLKLLNGELEWSTRLEVLKVLGIMGALDPHAHKRNQHKLPGQHREVLRPTMETAQHIVSMEELPTDFWPSFSASEDYYSTVAISSLMRILHDPSLSSYHQMVVGSLIFIFKSMGLGCVPYLPKVLPELFRAVRMCEDGGLKEFITWKLGTLVSIVRQHIRKYLQEILSLVSELWTSSFSLPAPNRTVQGPQASPVLHLVEQLCLALNDEFRMYILHILPSCIQVLGDAERCNDYYYVPDILHTLEVFGGNLDEHMHLVAPVLVRLFKVELVDIRRRAIVTLTKLIPTVQLCITRLLICLSVARNNDDLRKDAAEALCCLAHALGEDFTIFVSSIHKLLVKHHMRYRKWDEIENRLLRREPLISENLSVQKYTQCPPEVISDPLDDFGGVPSEEADETQRQPRSHQVNDVRLRSAGEASQRSTREDWAEWMRHFSIALLKESPSPALRTCARLAQLQPSVGRELFAAGFASCWAQMNETSQEQLVRSLKTAFSSQNIPPEILATLLNLAEFMEHDEKPLPIDTRLLGALAEKCRAFAKALHYKEMEFEAVCSKKMGANPVTVVESLIHINNQLHQHEAAIGILTYSQQHLEVQLKESWYEKLHRWDEALKAYKAKSSQASGPLQNLDATLALARWEDLSALCREQWTGSEPSARLEMAPMAANAAWHMGEWDHMAEYVSRLDDGDENKLRILGNTTASGDGSSNGAFFRAVLSVRCKKYEEARVYVERARRCLATELAALVLESYERAYNNMVRVQQLSELEEFDPESSPELTLYHGHPQVVLAYLKYQYAVGDELKRRDAFCRLQDLSVQLATATNSYSGTLASQVATSNAGVPLIARVYLTLASWKRALSPGLDDDSIQEILVSYKNATLNAKDWGKAWHLWALFNTEVMSRYTLRGRPDIAGKYVVAAVTGYFYSIACASTTKGVDDSLQIIARIHSNNKIVRELIQSLLVRIGKDHPQALMYPLLVACKSISILRQRAAQEVVDKIRQHSGGLVDQAQLVSKELIRVAILWHEMWHEALEEASRMYFGEHNIEGMLAVLEPLHAMLERGPETIKENTFIQAYGHELLEAHECCLKYRATGEDAELTKAWDLYYHVFRRIDKQLPSLTTLDLHSVSPELLECRKLELAVPGTYSADAPLVTIEYFVPQLIVITSKQRPRKLTIHGSDGNDYAFLLKGHEDLRQDERVMQLFGLVNTLLENSRKTSEKDLSIQRYAVIPLSPNSGLIGWVPNCDTLHALIREYRDARKIFLNQEHRCMLSFAPDYDHLPLIAKVEVFQHALENSEGNDLAKVLWLKSRTSEVWLERRTNYTRSLAVMSMVGYLLGLGDRHPSNLMLDRYSGKILHIDFGDCFEASMNREKFPEKVPFRLTRMLVKAMEVSGIEGTFRTTCENVMQVLRTNKDSVMAMMEAFVHDPLINWRLFNFNEVPQVTNYGNAHSHTVVNSEEAANRELMQPPRGARERELLQAVNQLGDANEVLNERAVAVMARMSHKLTGRDFSSGSSLSGAGSSTQHGNEHLASGDTREVEPGLSVKVQVQRLILQATSHENLCQNYVGWCPFW